MAEGVANTFAKLYARKLHEANSVYVVQGDREVLIPDRPEFVRSIDPAAGRMVVHLIEGM